MTRARNQRQSNHPRTSDAEDFGKLNSGGQRMRIFGQIDKAFKGVLSSDLKVRNKQQFFDKFKEHVLAKLNDAEDKIRSLGS